MVTHDRAALRQAQRKIVLIDGRNAPAEAIDRV